MSRFVSYGKWWIFQLIILVFSEGDDLLGTGDVLLVLRITGCPFTPIWVFPKIGVSQNGWFRIENPIKMDDLGIPLVLETPIY